METRTLKARQTTMRNENVCKTWTLFYRNLRVDSLSHAPTSLMMLLLPPLAPTGFVSRVPVFETAILW